MPNDSEQSCHQPGHPLLLHLGSWADPTPYPILAAEAELSELHIGPASLLLLQQPPKRQVLLLKTTLSNQGKSHEQRKDGHHALPPSPMSRWLQETVESPWTVCAATRSPEPTPQCGLLSDAGATRTKEIGEEPASLASARCTTEKLSTNVEVGSHPALGPAAGDREACVAY
jgi:hypothetical protein